MKEIEVNFENCYGIKKLNETISWEKEEKDGKIDKTNVCLIYAPNGTMKTSFAHTFSDIEKDITTIDRIVPENKTIREVKIDGQPINKDEILVINSYVKGYESLNESKLLASEKIKKQYDEIWNEINKNETIFLNDIKKVSGISKLDDIENEIINTFKEKDSQDLCMILEKIFNEHLIENNDILTGINYKSLFNKEVEKIIAQPEFVEAVDGYIKRYNEIVEESVLYKAGVFDNLGANKALKVLNDTGFFKANHKIELVDGEKLNNTEFKNKIAEAEDTILKDEEIKKKFKNIENILDKNADTRKFKEIIKEKPLLIPMLKNYNELKKKIWLNYFAENIESFNIFIELYIKNKKPIKDIIDKAKEEKTLWESVTRTFSDRFDVPFKISIQNREDVILKEKALTINFEYNTGKENKAIDRTKLEECLSEGERRALYILNILYELEARRMDDKEYLVIIDDIADSFDYKNKYAIIEYLYDIAKIENKFKLIILTHNFDFYRSISSRLTVKGNKYFAIKDEDGIKLKKGQYTKNVFAKWKKQINKPEIFISSIAFIRNIIEYLDGEENEDYLLLTKLLHYIENDRNNIKPTNEILVSDVLRIYEKYWKIDCNEIGIDKNKKMIDLIFETADDITEKNKDEILIENKITLSIAIRLKAEMYMIKKIGNKEATDNIQSNQTIKLLEILKSSCNEDEEIITIMEEVLIMTSENIHLNSFMYEPIIDMSESYLIKLYDKVSKL